MDLRARLGEIVGPAHVAADGAMEEYAHDSTFVEWPPQAVVLPGTTEEVAAVARLCSETGTPLTTRGAGSGLVGGPVPLSGGVVLSTERMASIQVFERDLMAVAGAGAITGDIDAAAGEHGLMYPPDPGSVSMCSIGGNVACNSGGMHCLKYGVTADYVTGLVVVLIDGTVLRLGGRLRKRSSGYRLQSLFVGSEGTLGIVTEVTVKLIPRPRHHAVAMVSFASIEDASEAVGTLLTSGHFPAALELLNQSALGHVRELLPAGLSPDHAAVLIVEQDGGSAEGVLMELAEMVEVLHGTGDWVAQTEAEREGLWKARRTFGQVLRQNRKNVFGEDVAVPLSQIPEMVRRFEAQAREHGMTLPAVAHVGDGNLHPNFLFEESQRPLVAPMAAQILRDAVELGGTVSAEHGLGCLKRDFAVLEHGEEAIGWWRRIKDVFDPKGLLNPHKVFPEQPADDRFLDAQPGWGKTLASGLDRTESGV
jgi:glycolate oxidase